MQYINRRRVKKNPQLFTEKYGNPIHRGRCTKADFASSVCFTVQQLRVDIYPDIHEYDAYSVIIFYFLRLLSMGKIQ